MIKKRFIIPCSIIFSTLLLSHGGCGQKHNDLTGNIVENLCEADHFEYFPDDNPILRDTWLKTEVSNNSVLLFDGLTRNLTHVMAVFGSTTLVSGSGISNFSTYIFAYKIAGQDKYFYRFYSCRGHLYQNYDIIASMDQQLDLPKPIIGNWANPQIDKAIEDLHNYMRGELPLREWGIWSI